jgi:hypothetical protein
VTPVDDVHSTAGGARVRHVEWLRRFGSLGGRAVGLRLHHLLNDTRCCRSARAVTMFGLSGITAVSPAIGTAIVLFAELCVWACL